MEFRSYIDAQSNSTRIDRLSLKTPPTVPKQDYRPTLSLTDMPMGSLRNEKRLSTPPSGSLKNFSSDRGTVCKTREAVSTLENVDQERVECLKWARESREKASTNTVEPLSPQSTVISHQDLSMSPCHRRAQDDEIAIIKRLPVKDLLNDSISPAGYMHPQQSTTKVGSPPSTETNLGNIQQDAPTNRRSDVKSLISYKRNPSNITPPLENSASHGHTSRACESARGANVKPDSRPRREKTPLDGKVVAQELRGKAKVFIPLNTTPDSWVTLSIDALFSQTPSGFFHLYSQTAGAGEVSMLSFSLPDVTWQLPQNGNISRGDSDAFYALKRAFWDCFCVSLFKYPRLVDFRVVVIALAPHVVDDRVAISKHSLNKLECGRASEPLTMLVRQKHHHPHAIPARMALRQDKPVNEASTAVQITVRIQVNEHGQFSRRFDKNVLLSEIANVDFFAWFACHTGCARPSGPEKLKVTLKDALPTPVHGRIRRGNEEDFEYVKRDMKPHLERAKALMPGLSEFVILVTVPGWTVEAAQC